MLNLPYACCKTLVSENFPRCQATASVINQKITAETKKAAILALKLPFLEKFTVLWGSSEKILNAKCA